MAHGVCSPLERQNFVTHKDINRIAKQKASNIFKFLQALCITEPGAIAEAKLKTVVTFTIFFLF